MSLKEENEYLKNQLKLATAACDTWRNRCQSWQHKWEKTQTKYDNLIREIHRPDTYHDDMEANNDEAVG